MRTKPTWIFSLFLIALSISCTQSATLSSNLKEKTSELESIITDGVFYRVDSSRGIKLQSFVYDNAWDYYEDGLARFIANSKIGFHDKFGNIVIEALYDFASPFKNGRSIVCLGCQAKSDGEHSTMEGGSWGAIDKKGEVIIPIELASWKEVQEYK